MNVAASLALQSLPFAGLVLAGGQNRDIFAVSYVAAFGLIVSLVLLLGDPSGFAVAFGRIVGGLE